MQPCHDIAGGRPPVWDAVEIDVPCSPPHAGPAGVARRGARPIMLALAVTLVTTIALRGAADPAAALVFGGLMGLLCYLNRDAR